MKSFLLRRNTYLLITLIVILVGVIGVLTFDGAVQDVASSVIATGLVSLFYVYSRYIEEVRRERRKAFDKAGLWGVTSTRRIEYAPFMASAGRRVDVMGYSLRAFTDDHAPALLAKNPAHFRARIIVVNPASPASISQESLEGHAPGTFSNSVDRLKNKLGGQAHISIKAIDHAPSTMVFRMDDAMFVGPYLAHVPSASTPTFELRSPGWLFEEFEKEFDQLWAAAQPLP